MRRALPLVSIAVGFSLSYALGTAHAAQGFWGRVVDGQQKPVAGAIVSARNRALTRTTTVYADDQGRYRLPDLAEGEYDVRARHFGFKDRMKMAVKPGSRALDLTLVPENDEYDRMAALPSNRWFALALASMPNDHMREEFERQCTFCHQQGSWPTRVERTPAQWEKIFSLMARMGGILSSDTRKALPGVLNAAYDHNSSLQKLKEQLERYPLATGAGLPAVIDEWEVGDRASVQHDIVVHPAGYVFSVDTTKDFLYRLDPRTGERKAFKIPDGGLPLAGVFHNTSNVLPPNADAHVAPHSLQVAADGKIWVTLCMGNKIGVFDPKAESWRLIDLKDGLYPHTLRFDQKGRVWFTLAVSNQVGMIDPSTGEQRIIRLPSRTWTQALAVRATPWLLGFAKWIPQPETVSEGAMLPVPYGIDIAPDGGVWFSQLNVHRIGRIDPETGRYELFDTPFPGPRRLRFDSKGNLWIPGFSAGLLARFDPKTKEFKTWPLPTNPPGTETPYALNVDRRTDTVWICGTNSDTLMRFDPATEKFVIYPLPTRVTYTREIDFDSEGGIWTSNSNTPGWHIETANPQIIRLLEHGTEAAEVAAR
ncbi:MAG TPA: carboxypeptidase regulatory-like domain-containing protein [Candidatus Binatia bacterium]|nr:carboxypeptidase regulatory-like domain-containing protein [Candidatus Binatia bacterium]